MKGSDSLFPPLLGQGAVKKIVFSHCSAGGKDSQMGQHATLLPHKAVLNILPTFPSGLLLMGFKFFYNFQVVSAPINQSDLFWSFS